MGYSLNATIIYVCDKCGVEFIDVLNSVNNPIRELPARDFPDGWYLVSEERDDWRVFCGPCWCVMTNKEAI